MKHLRHLLLLAATLVAAAASWAAPPPLTLLADGFPPLQHEGADGQPSGYVHAFVQELLLRAGVAARPLQFVPLKRALAVAQAEPNVLLLSIARTPEREEELIWLREVAPYKLWLYRARNSAAPAPRSLAELKGRGLRFGVQDGSNFEAWLRRQGIGPGSDNSSIEAVRHNAQNLRKALLQRIDLFAHPDLSLAYRAREQGLASDDFEAVLPIPELSSPLWLALSRGSDPMLQQALLRAADALIAAGRLDILRKQHAMR